MYVPHEVFTPDEDSSTQQYKSLDILFDGKVNECFHRCQRVDHGWRDQIYPVDGFGGNLKGIIVSCGVEPIKSYGRERARSHARSRSEQYVLISLE